MRLARDLFSRTRWYKAGLAEARQHLMTMLRGVMQLHFSACSTTNLWSRQCALPDAALVGLQSALCLVRGNATGEPSHDWSASGMLRQGWAMQECRWRSGSVPRGGAAMIRCEPSPSTCRSQEWRPLGKWVSQAQGHPAPTQGHRMGHFRLPLASGQQGQGPASHTQKTIFLL